MELDGCGQESGGHLVVELQSCCGQLLSDPLHLRGESTADVTQQNALIDGLQGLVARETDSEHTTEYK